MLQQCVKVRRSVFGLIPVIINKLAREIGADRIHLASFGRSPRLAKGFANLTETLATLSSWRSGGLRVVN